MLHRIDQARLPEARRILDYTIGRIREDGRFHPLDGLFPETTGYQAELAATLAMAGKLLDEPRYTGAARRMFERLLANRVEGLWSLDWWWDFPVTLPAPPNWREQNLVPDVRYTITTLLCLGVYYQASGDERVVAPTQEALRLALTRWNFAQDDFFHLTLEFAALAAALWSPVLPEMAPYVAPLVDRMAQSFVEIAPRDFPFVTTVRTLALLGTSGTQYLTTAIQPAIEALLAAPQWRFPHNPHDFRHIASTEDHINIRGNGAMALTFRLFDLAAGEAHYTATPLYAHLSAWLDGMRDPHAAFYEGQMIASGQRFGHGAPASYLPLWWIFGGLGV
ncbi:MAG: hypothetical protein HY326_11435 [Chloroflexi bacterium]|nr:hypothetical protein [Chloroflexota bacterium]